MTPREIEQLAGQAGFKRMPLNDSVRILFTGGDNMLNVHTDGKWAFYTEVVRGKSPDTWGKDFESLLAFLTSESKNKVTGVS